MGFVVDLRNGVRAATACAAIALIAGCGGSSATKTTPAATTSPVTTSVAVTTTSPVVTSAPAASSTSTSGATTTVAPVAARGVTGKVSNVAGGAKDDGSGVPGPVATASLGSKVRFAVAANGDLYVSNGSLSVLKVSGGQVSVFAQLDPPGGPGLDVAVGADGSVFVATSSTVVKFTTAGKGVIVLGTAAAGLSTSLGPIALDAAGNLYVADGSRRITRVGTDGKTKVIAGTGTQAPVDSAVGDGGPATASPLGTPSQLLIDAGGNLFIADTSAHRVRRVTPDGTITTIAGGGTTTLAANAEQYAPEGTLVTKLKLTAVSGIALDSKGRIYVADGPEHAVFRFGTNAGMELVIADQKGGASTAGFAANQTRAANVGQLAVDASGNLLYLESSALRAIAGIAS